MLDKFYKALNKSLDKASPKVVPNTKSRDFVWYKTKHDMLSKKVNAAYVTFVKNRSPENKTDYKNSLKI